MTTNAGMLLETKAQRLTGRESWVTAAIVSLLIAPAWATFSADAPGLFGTLTGMITLMLVSICAITDLAERKIFNWATYPAFAWAIGINVIALFANRPVLGAVGINGSLAGAGVCLVLMLVAYNLAHGGAGDVKLAVVIGALLGAELGVLAVAYSYVIAATCILIWVGWRRGPLTLMAAMTRKIGASLLPGYVISVDGRQQALLEKPVPLAGFFAIGTMLAMLEPVLS